MTARWDDGLEPSMRTSVALIPVGAAGLLIAFFVMQAHHPLAAAVFALAVLFGAFLLVAWADHKVERACDEARKVEITPRAAAAIVDLMALDAELRGYES